MTRSEQPAQPATDVTEAFATDLSADSRERAVGALLKIPTLRKLWSAQLTGAVADRLGLLVLLVLTVQATVTAHSFGGGYRGVAYAVAAVFAARLVATLLFGAVLLGPLTGLTAESGPLDRRWTMIGADGVRLALFIVAPLWVTWVPHSAHLWLLATAFAAGLAERLWTVAKDGAAPGLLPPAGDTSVRPAPDHLATLHRLDLRTSFVALPLAAASLVVVTLVNTLIAVGVDWFHLHQVALSSYVAAGLFSSSMAVLYLLELPAGSAAKPHSPLQGLRLPKGPAGAERGRTGALPLLVLATAAVAGAIGVAVSVAVLHALALGFGPTGFGLLVLTLTAGTVIGIRIAPHTLPALSRRRLLAVGTGVTGVALLLTGIVPDQATVLLLSLLAGTAAGVTANAGHTLIEQEAEESRRVRSVEHLHAVVRAVLAVAAIGGPLVAAAIGPHRIQNGHFTFDHSGAAYTLILVGALLLPVAALVLGKTDDRTGVPLRRDLREALRGAEPATGPAATGFFIAIEGGDGAGKSTQVEAIAEWIRAKGHEVVVTREPGATAVGKRLRSILLDVSSAGVSHRAEALLYAADRAEHVDTVVKPALDRGAVVISDRYIDSSVAYQGAGRDLAPTEIARISRWATDGLVPHLTVLLDVPPETARERFTEAPDRLESEPAEFHQRVRSGFLTLAAADPARYLVVDAAQEPEAITTVVRHRLDRMLPLSAQEIEARAEAERKAAEEAARLAAEEAARKAEEERQARERQEQLERLRREEEERRLAAEEAARREIAERKAAQEAEAARLAAEEAAQRQAEEDARIAAEEAARAAEQERLRRLAEEQARLRAEAAEKRQEKQRKAEEALLRAEAARAAAAAASDSEETAVLPAVSDAPPADSDPGSDSGSGSGSGTDSGSGSSSDSGSGSGSGARSGSGSGSDAGPDSTSGAPSDADETTVLPALRDEPHAGPDDVSDSDRTAVLPAVAPPASSSSETTTVMTPITPEPEPAPTPRPQSQSEPAPETSGSNDETTELPPPTPGTARSDDPTDRVPPWLFRPDQPTGDERTHEIPAAQAARRPRPEWAEETPLDDLPTLADELLGPHDREDPPRG
ncbi:dTMP kinase [Streptomyces sp. NPDC088194]|uniref:dTMP kinase n=1 Tax=Streptomyces sp. NPDC088194 TaxID=3154931 RepID=UPI00344D5E45